jgi:hypothetical protein
MIDRRFSRSIAFTALLVVTSPLIAPLAHADPTAADKETARTLMQEGRAKRDKGDHGAALEAFKSAHQLMRLPTTGVELGREQIEVGQLVEARDTLLEVTRMNKTDGEPASFATARKDAQKLADAIAPRIPSIRFIVKGLDDGEQRSISVDGVVVPPSIASAPRKVNPGAHHIVVTARATERSADVTLAEGASTEAAIDFTGVAKPVAAKEEQTASSDGAAVAPSASATTATTDVAPVKSGGISPLVWVGFGVALAGTITGTVSGVAHLANTSLLEQKCPNGSCPSRYDADYDRTKTLGTVSTISFVVAGAGLGLGIYGLLSGPSNHAEARTASRPTIKPVVGFGSLGVVGQF